MATNLPHLQDVQQISDTPRIVRILGGNPSKFTLQGTNTYLIGPSASLTLLDTGQGEHAWRDSLASHLSPPSSITSTILSHWHPDHIGGIPHLLAHPSASHTAVYKHNPAYLGYGEVAARVDVKPLRNADWRPIADGQSFDVGDGWRLKALHTPGHTTDHMCFLLVAPDGSVKGMFTGDNVLGHGTAVFEHLKPYMDSLETMRAALDSTSHERIPLYPGHGAVVADGKAKLDEYIEHRAMRERQVVEVLRRGGAWTSMQIVKVVYADVPESLHAAAEGGVRQVLGKLEVEGKVVCENAEGADERRWRIKEGSSSL